MARFAPEECVFYTTWSASAAANPASRNQAEQMLAEPEVRQFVEHLEKWIRHAVSQPAPIAKPAIYPTRLSTPCS